MKKSNKIITIALALTCLGALAYAGTSAYGLINAAQSSGWTDVQVEDYYRYNTDFSIPNAMYVNGSNVVTATHSFVYPSKNATSDSEVTLNEIGEYTIQYFAEVSGVTKTLEKTFKVDYPSIMHSDKTTVTYGIHKYARSDDSEVTYQPYKGRDTEAMLVRLAKGDTLTFSKLIDISSLTKEDILIDGFLTPDSRGTNDFTKIYFRFTDASDANTYFDFVFQNYSEGGTAWAKAAGNDQPLSGWNYYDNSGMGSLHQGDEFGTSAGCSFAAFRGHAFLDPTTGTIRQEVIPTGADAPESTFEVHYDQTNQALFFHDTQVIDLDNPAYFAKGWPGFKSNKVRLSVTAEGIAGESANFAISKVYGYTANELMAAEESTFRDSEGPLVEFEQDITKLPKAVAGYSYPIPTAYGYDIYSGQCEVTAKAWYDYNSANKTRVSIVNGVIQTKYPGSYVIEYVAKDVFGNETIRPLYITCLDKVDPITFDVDGIPSTIEVGSRIVLPTPTNIQGGSGDTFVTVEAEIEGEKEIINNSFVFERVGIWKIIYTVTDFVGTSSAKEFNVNVTESTHPSLYEDAVIPAYHISDLEVEVPTLIAKDYRTGKTGVADVLVTDSTGTTTYQGGAKFTPKGNDVKEVITFEFVYDGYSLSTKTSYLMNVYEEVSMYGTIINQLKEERFFDAKGMAMTTTNTSLDVAITGANSGFTFITPQSSSEVAIVLKNFSMRQGESISMTLLDYYDFENSVTATLTKVDGGAILSYGDNAVKTALTMDGNNEFKLAFVDGVFSVNDNNVGGALVNEFKDSDRVYLRIDTDMKVGESFTIKSLNGFTFTSAVKDTTGPKIHLLGAYGGSYSINSVYHVCAATAFDVLFPNNKYFTVTVKDPKGNYVVDNNGVTLNEVSPSASYDFVLEQYGNYTVDYKAADAMNNASDFSYLVNVSDETRPEITLKSEPAKNAKVGDTLYLAEYEVKDNVTPSDKLTVWAYVINPNGIRLYFENEKNSIVAKYAGVYEFHIMAIDEASNIGEVVYRVNVSK
ncbi:MAG: hypothetical protein MJ239_01925 [Bacilli bacterium]|nr:hypothetical protein [Bacilli bacterium]